jgi:regulatory protein
MRHVENIMKKISNIKQIDSNKFAVIIDNKKHIILGDVLLEYNILKPCEIDDSIYNKITASNDFYTIYSKIVKFILAKLRTEKEIINKLYKLNAPKSMHQKIISKLKEDGYLNDEKYITSYINDQVNLTLNGPKKIKYELLKLSLKEDLINKYLNTFDENIWEEKVDKIISKKIKSNHNLSKNKFLLKLKNDLNNLGYEEKYFIDKLNKIDFDDEEGLIKDYNKYYIKYSKYDEAKRDYMIKQKLYSLGYDLNKIDKIKHED